MIVSAASPLNALAFPKHSQFFTPFSQVRRFVLDFLLIGQLSSSHPVPVKGRFRERHEAVRDATGPSRLSKLCARGPTRHVACGVTYGSRGRTAQGPSNATGSHSVKAPAAVPLGVASR